MSSSALGSPERSNNSDNKKDLFVKLRNNDTDGAIAFINNNLASDFNIKDDSGIYLIFYVVALNNLKLLTKLLETNIKIDVYDSDGRTILYTPIKYGFVEIVRKIINYSAITVGIPVQSLMDDFGNIAIHYALMFNNRECFDLLLPISNCSTTDKTGYNSLHHAVITRNLSYVEQIFKKDNGTNTQNNTGETPLHLACRMSIVDIAKFLIDNSSDLNIQEYQIRSAPLHYACYSGNEKIVAMLLDNDADVNTQDFDGNTPAHYCIMHNKINILHLLSTHKKSAPKLNVNLFNIKLMLPLHFVFNSPNDNMHAYINILLPKTNLNFQNIYGVTCLYELCRMSLWNKYSDILKTKKLDIVVRTSNNKRPIDFVDDKSMDTFINMVVDSYMFRLTKTGKVWTNEWENTCTSDKTKCMKTIKQKIVKLINSPDEKDCHNKSYPVSQKSTKCIPIKFDETVAINTMIGMSLDVISGLIHLSEKHVNTKIAVDTLSMSDTSKCVFYEKNLVPNRGTFECMLEGSFITWYKNMLDIHPFIKDFTQQNYASADIEYLIYFVNIIHASGSAHANILMYTKKTNEMERFDPFGSGQNDLLDAKLEKYFGNIIPNLKYASPREYMSTVGLQKIDIYENANEYIGDPEGYCVSWSMWYVDMRITFPDITREKLIKFIMRQVGEKQLRYRSIIRNYSRNITLIRDYILYTAGLDVNKYNNGEYVSADAQIILEEVNKLLRI